MGKIFGGSSTQLDLMAGRYKLAVNCPVYACLLIILSSFTLKEVSNGDSYIKTKVSELYVGSSLINTSLFEMSTTQQTKRPREKFEYGHVWGVRLLRVTRDVLLTNLVLLGGDVALNPVPVARVQCSKCLKPIYDVPLRTKIGRQKSCSKKIIQFKTPKYEKKHSNFEF